MATRKQKAKQVWTLDELASMYELPEFGHMESIRMNAWEIGHRAYVEARKEAYEGHLEEWEYDDEEEAEREAMKAAEKAAEEARDEAEQAVMDDGYRQWHNAITAAIEQTLEHVGLELDPVRRHEPHPYEYKIQPEKTWHDAAKRLAVLIEGVGTAIVPAEDYADDPKEFVLSRLVWTTQWSEVYGGPSPQMIFDRNLD